MAELGMNVKKSGVQNLDRSPATKGAAVFRLDPITLSYVRFALRFALQAPWLGIKLDLDVAAENRPSGKGRSK
jgi:hypothetical protein